MRRVGNTVCEQHGSGGVGSPVLDSAERQLWSASELVGQQTLRWGCAAGMDFEMAESLLVRAAIKIMTVMGMLHGHAACASGA